MAVKDVFIFRSNIQPNDRPVIEGVAISEVAYFGAIACVMEDGLPSKYNVNIRFKGDDGWKQTQMTQRTLDAFVRECERAPIE